MTNKHPVGFYKKDGKTRPITPSSGSARNHTSKATRFSSGSVAQTNAAGQDPAVMRSVTRMRWNIDRQIEKVPVKFPEHFDKERFDNPIVDVKIVHHNPKQIYIKRKNDDGKIKWIDGVDSNDLADAERWLSGRYGWLSKKKPGPKPISAARIAELKDDPQRQAEAGIFISDRYDHPFKLKKKGGYLYAWDLEKDSSMAAINLRTGRAHGVTEYFGPLRRAHEERKAGND